MSFMKINHIRESELNIVEKNISITNEKTYETATLLLFYIQ